MPRILTIVAIGLVGALVGAVVGLITGANIGGNWFTSLTVAGQRGYEATGAIGAVLGAIGVGLVAVLITRRRLPRA